MGHLVNATAFRLGYSRNWISSWVSKGKTYKKFLHEDLLIFRFVKLFFTQYSYPIYTNIFNRSNRQKPKRKDSAQDKLIANQFIDFTFVFSNISISRALFLEINCYFLDSLLEQWRLAFIHALTHTSNSFFRTKLLYKKRRPIMFTDLKVFPKLYLKTFTRRHKTRRRKSRFRSIFKFRLKKIFRVRKHRLRRYHIFKKNVHSRRWQGRTGAHLSRLAYKRNRSYHKKIEVKKTKIRLKYLKTKLGMLAKKLKKKPKKTKIKKLKIAQHKYRAWLEVISKKEKLLRRPKNFIFWLRFFPVALFEKEIYAIPTIRVKKLFVLTKIFLKLFRRVARGVNLKYQLFFIIVLKNLLLAYLRFPKYVHYPNSKLIRCLNLLIIKEFAFKHLNFFYFKKVFQERYFIFQGASSAIYSSIKAFDKNDIVKVSFWGMHVRNLTASFITQYIILKLAKYFTIQEILRPVLHSLKRASYIKGFRIIVAGRLTRKERAAYIIRRNGEITLANKSKPIDYAADFKVMRFGVVGVKIWFYSTVSRPYFYRFSYTYKMEKNYFTYKNDASNKLYNSN